ncbi:MAG: 50S ribosomal protein L23 [Patescibacteria group bacterium]
MAFFSQKKNIDVRTARTDSVRSNESVHGDEMGIVLAMHVTEKAMTLSEKGTYVFKVSRHATKPQILRAIEKMYGVHVAGVRVVNARGKMVIVARSRGRTSDWRKAMVTLRKGETIKG